jgi:4a-hydroxytetrahydrobiopterin dehydratase
MRLSDAERDEALRDLPGWSWDAGASTIRRTFHFADFSEAFAFMTRVALAAEKADHHPDWSNSWNRVDVALATHSEGGVTRRDIDLARQMDAFASLAPGETAH